MELNCCFLCYIILHLLFYIDLLSQVNGYLSVCSCICFIWHCINFFDIDNNSIRRKIIKWKQLQLHHRCCWWHVNVILQIFYLFSVWAIWPNYEVIEFQPQSGIATVLDYTSSTTNIPTPPASPVSAAFLYFSIYLFHPIAPPPAAILSLITSISVTPDPHLLS